MGRAKSAATLSESLEGRVPKGHVPVLVGLDEDMERFLVHTKFLKHPCIVVLLEKSAQEFGYEQKGVLQIPCHVEHFRDVLGAITKAT